MGTPLNRGDKTRKVVIAFTVASFGHRNIATGYMAEGICFTLLLCPQEVPEHCRIPMDLSPTVTPNGRSESRSFVTQSILKGNTAVLDPGHNTAHHPITYTKYIFSRY